MDINLWMYIYIRMRLCINIFQIYKLIMNANINILGIEIFILSILFSIIMKLNASEARAPKKLSLAPCEGIVKLRHTLLVNYRTKLC